MPTLQKTKIPGQRKYEICYLVEVFLKDSHSKLTYSEKNMKHIRHKGKN